MLFSDEGEYTQYYTRLVFEALTVLGVILFIILAARNLYYSGKRRFFEMLTVSLLSASKRSYRKQIGFSPSVSFSQSNGVNSMFYDAVGPISHLLLPVVLLRAADDPRPSLLSVWRELPHL